MFCSRISSDEGGGTFEITSPHSSVRLLLFAAPEQFRSVVLSQHFLRMVRAMGW